MGTGNGSKTAIFVKYCYSIVSTGNTNKRLERDAYLFIVQILQKNCRLIPIKNENGRFCDVFVRSVCYNTISKKGYIIAVK